MSDANGDGDHGQETLIEETLRPLTERRGELVDKMTGFEKLALEVRREIKAVDKILRAGGLLEPTGGRPPKAAAVRQRGRGVSEERLEEARRVIRRLDAEFTIREMTEIIRTDNSSGKAIIEALRAEGELRLVGAKHPKGTPPHVKAAHYALIERG